jgi:HPt (histidine-containing phosphotransfer) domain-containing protein
MEVPTDILFRYMGRRKKDLEICLLSLKDENFTELEKVGHQLKGNGITFGYADLSMIGTNMELAAKDMNVPEIEKALEEFSSWVTTHIN